MVLAIPLLAMVAFSVDYGFLLSTRTDLQRAADAAALAAAVELSLPGGSAQDALDQAISYLGTWSGLVRYRDSTGDDPAATLDRGEARRAAA